MKIYTKKGDTGETSLFGGQKVLKSSKRIDTYGTVDELNSIVGAASSYSIDSTTRQLLNVIQKQLFVLGADLSTPFSRKEKINRIGKSEIEFLEHSIDELEKSLEPLISFILPGGSQAGAQLHVARTVCRRAERLAVECLQEEDISEISIKYLNRLSDFLFMLARFENMKAGKEEIKWVPRL